MSHVMGSGLAVLGDSESQMPSRLIKAAAVDDISLALFTAYLPTSSLSDTAHHLSYVVQIVYGSDMLVPTT